MSTIIIIVITIIIHLYHPKPRVIVILVFVRSTGFPLVSVPKLLTLPRQRLLIRIAQSHYRTAGFQGVFQVKQQEEFWN
jgi:hypothetical protein